MGRPARYPADLAALRDGSERPLARHRAVGREEAGAAVAVARAAGRSGQRQVIGFPEYLRFIVTLTAVLDPFLAVPLFLALTANQSHRNRVVLVRVVALTVFGVLAASALLGEAILELMGTSLGAFRV